MVDNYDYKYCTGARPFETERVLAFNGLRRRVGCLSKPLILLSTAFPETKHLPRTLHRLAHRIFLLPLHLTL